MESSEKTEAHEHAVGTDDSGTLAKKKKRKKKKHLQPGRLVNITFLKDARDPHTRLKNCMHSCEISGLCTWWVALLLLN